MLLYYIHDLVRLKRWQSQMQFVAHQMASMLQNISQNRTDKTITQNDIRYAMSAAYLTIFPGTTRFAKKDAVADYGYTPMLWIYCIKGNSDSTASVVWAQRYHMTYESTPESVRQDGSISRTTVNNSKNVPPSQIYPTLKIEQNEVKIIVECAIHYSRSPDYSFTDGRLCSEVTPKQAFGFFVYPIAPPITHKANNDAIYFHSVVIFSPRPGLFSETAPK